MREFGIALLIVGFTLIGFGITGHSEPEPVVTTVPSHAEELPTTTTTVAPVPAPVPVPVPVPDPAPPHPTGDCSNIPAWFPAAIAWRESNCRYDVVSGDQQYFGAFQIWTRHWEPGGRCDDLDWQVPAKQDECAWRITNGGTDFHAWGA